MAIEQRAGLIIGRNQVASAVTAIRLGREESLRKQREEETAASTETVSFRQARELNALVDGGVQDLFVGAAQSLREEYPDVRVRVTKPTGDSLDAMAVVLEFDQQRTEEGIQSFRRIFAVPNRHINSGEREFALGGGSLLAPGSNLFARRVGENGGEEEQLYFSYDGGEEMLALAAELVAFRIQMPKRDLVRVDSGRSWLQRQRTPTVKWNDIERPFIEVQVPTAPVSAPVAA